MRIDIYINIFLLRESEEKTQLSVSSCTPKSFRFSTPKSSMKPGENKSSVIRYFNIFILIPIELSECCRGKVFYSFLDNLTIKKEFKKKLVFKKKKFKWK